MPNDPLCQPGSTKAVLLAAGLGTRLRPLTGHTPKCLVEIGGEALLGRWLAALAAAGVGEALLNTHHLADAVKRYIDEAAGRWPVRVTLFHEPALLGSAGTLAANASWADDADDCLIVYADNDSDADLAALLRRHREAAAPLTMMLFRAEDPSACGIVELDADDRVVGFVEKPQNPASDLANAGVYAVTRRAYREIAAMRAYDLGHDVLPRFVGRMVGWVHDGYHRDIGTPQSLRRARAHADAQAAIASRAAEAKP